MAVPLEIPPFAWVYICFVLVGDGINIIDCGPRIAIGTTDKFRAISNT
jgi:hypothetical protein